MYEVNKFSPIFNILILKVDTRCAFHSDGCSFPTITSSMEMWKNVGLTFLNFCWGFGWSFFWTCYHFAFPIFSWNDWKCKQKQIIFIALTDADVQRTFQEVACGRCFLWKDFCLIFQIPTHKFHQHFKMVIHEFNKILHCLKV